MRDNLKSYDYLTYCVKCMATAGHREQQTLTVSASKSATL